MVRSVTRFKLIFILSAVGLSACGGGGGGNSAGTGPVPTNAGGIWEGSTFDDRTGLTFQAAGVVTENSGDGRFINENGIQFVLSGISGNNGAISATITAIAPFGSTFLDGTVLTLGTLTGNVVERQSLQGDWSLNTGETGSVTMGFDSNYYEGSDLSRTEGLWLDPFGTTWDTSPTGEMFSQDSFGCVANGQISIIDQSYNAYDVAVTLSGPCGGIEGNYNGLAVTDTDGATANNVFVLQINNNEFIFTEAWSKMAPNTGGLGPYTGPVARDAEVLSFQQEFWANARTPDRCGNCHNEAVGQLPMFVRNDDVNFAYDAALTVVDTAQPASSRIVEKVAGGHNCWVADPAVCGAIMTTWIENWVGGGG